MHEPNSYVSSEALYHLMGGRDAGWVPHTVNHEDTEHWYLKNKKDGKILDSLSDGFETKIDYSKGRPRALHSREPSVPALQLIEKMKLKAASQNGELQKGLAGLAAGVGLMALGQMSPKLQTAFDKVNPPEKQAYEQVVNKAPQWTPDGLHAGLIPIAHLESTFGQFMDHAPHSKGEFHTAHGPVGMKPSTAHDEWTKSKTLKSKFPGLEDPATFMGKFKSDWKFHNIVASAHFMRLVQRHGSNEKAAYAWRWGSTACGRADPQTIDKDSYVQKYRSIAASAGLQKAESGPIDVKHYSVYPGLKQLHPDFQGSGATGAEKNRPSRIPRTYYYEKTAEPEAVVTAASPHLYHGTLPAGTKLYDFGHDHLDLTKPRWSNTRRGQVYEVPDFDSVEKKLVKLGFHGYKNYGVPGALAYFHPLKVKHVSTGNRPVRKSE